MPVHMPIYVLRRAISVMAYDCGAIYRSGPTGEEVAERVLQDLQREFTPMQLREVGDELDRMSADDVLELCSGEHGKVECSPQTNTILNAAFDLL